MEPERTDSPAIPEQTTRPAAPEPRPRPAEVDQRSGPAVPEQRTSAAEPSRADPAFPPSPTDRPARSATSRPTSPAPSNHSSASTSGPGDAEPATSPAEPEPADESSEPAYPPHSPWSTPPIRRSSDPGRPTASVSGPTVGATPIPAPRPTPGVPPSPPTSPTRATVPSVGAEPAAAHQPTPAPRSAPRPGWTRWEVTPPAARTTEPVGPRPALAPPRPPTIPAGPSATPTPTGVQPAPVGADEATTDRLAPPDHPSPYRPPASPPTGNPATPHPYVAIDVPLQYATPTAQDLAARRMARSQEWVGSTGGRAARRGTFGLVRLRPGRRERQTQADISAVRRSFGGLRQVTIVNPKGGAGKTVATLMLGMTFGQTRGGFVLAWDNNETQGTLGMRAQTDRHSRTVRDLLRDLHRFTGAEGRIGELAAYVRPQEGAAFDVLASDESATAGEMLTGTAFREIRAVVGRFYKLLIVDTGNNVRADNWQAAVDATDQLVVTMSARNDSAETAARLLDHLEQTGRRELVRRAVAVVTMPLHRQDADPKAIERHFEQRCRVVLRVPYDRHLDSGGPIDYSAVSPESRRAWLRVAAAIADGL